MKSVKYVLLALMMAAFGFSSYVACGGPQTTGGNENTAGAEQGTSTETTTNDGGTNNNNNNVGTDTSPQEEGPKEAGPAITATFEPASGAEIGIQDCIKVTFSRAPSTSRANRSAEMKQEGSSLVIAVSFSLTEAKGEICPFSLLRYEKKYTLSLKVKDPDDKTKEYPFTATYTTKKAPVGKPLEVSRGVNIKLKGLKSPAALQTLLGSVSPDQIPPILLTLHSRDDGAKGKLLFVGGLGKAPDGGKPHQGKDVVDTKTPVSLSLEGEFEGPSFFVGPTNFILSIAGFNLQLENLSLTGTFTDDGKSIKEAILEGVIDPELIKQQFGLDACATLLRDDCFKNSEGKDRVRIVGLVEGIENPLEFSVFVTAPLYLQQGLDGAATKVEVYSTTEIKDTDVTMAWSTCAGSAKEDKPCDTKEGAKITPATVDGTMTIDASKKHGTFAPKSALTAGTWYRVELTAKNSAAKEFKTFFVFKTK